MTSIGGECFKINTSYSYAYNKACKVKKKLSSDNIKENWTEPAKCIVHHDGKLMEALDKSCKEERFPIVVSGDFGIKLLGIPTLGHDLKGRYGSTAAAEVINKLDKWKCKDSVFGMVFDTPYSNIGHLTRAYISIERSLGRPLLQKFEGAY